MDEEPIEDFDDFVAAQCERFTHFTPEDRLRILSDLGPLIADGVNLKDAIKTLAFFAGQVHDSIKMMFSCGPECEQACFNSPLERMMYSQLKVVWCEHIERTMLVPLVAGMCEEYRTA